MSITFPLSLAAFADELNVTSLKPRPGWQQEYSSLGTGESLAADVAPALREFDVTLMAVPHDDANELVSIIESLGGIVGTFYLHDPRYVAPKSDPDGALLGDASVTIHSLNANNKAMALEGLPAGYVLGVGDRICWDYGSDPTRRAYHRLVEGATADGDGVTPEFEVRDFIRTGSSTGLPVTLLKPAFKCRMISGSLDESADGSMTTISFSVRQVI